jgi:hypothetical protein
MRGIVTAISVMFIFSGFISAQDGTVLLRTADEVVGYLNNQVHYGQTVRIAAGDYSFSQPIYVQMNSAGLIIQGMGERSTRFYLTDPSQTLFFIQSDQVTIRDLTIQGAIPVGNYTTTGNGIVLNGSSCKIENVVFYDLNIAIRNNGSWMNSIKGCNMCACNYGIWVLGSTSSTYGSIGLTIRDCTIADMYNYGIYFQRGEDLSDCKLPMNVKIEDNFINGCGLSGIRIECGRNIAITNNEFEENEWQSDKNDDADISIVKAPAPSNLQVYGVYILNNYSSLSYAGKFTLGHVVCSGAKAPWAGDNGHAKKFFRRIGYTYSSVTDNDGVRFLHNTWWNSKSPTNKGYDEDYNYPAIYGALEPN